MSAVPPGWTATIPLRCCASKKLSSEPQRGSVVRAAGPTASRIAHVFEENGVLMAVLAAASAAAKQFHWLDRDARQIRINHEPAEVLMAFAIRVSYRQCPHPFGAIGAADKDFLTVHHIFIAVTN